MKILKVGDRVSGKKDKGSITAVSNRREYVAISWDSGGTTTEDARQIQPSSPGHFDLVK